MTICRSLVTPCSALFGLWSGRVTWALLCAALLRRKTRTVLTLLSVFVAFVLFGLLQAVTMAFQSGADSADAIREFTQRCTDVLEMYVRRHPELWLWMHRRWREDPS